MDGEYRVLSHTADTGVEATADSFESVVATTAVGMFGLMYDLAALTDTTKITAVVPLTTPHEEVLVDALSELLYRSEAEDLVFTAVTVTQSGDAHLRLVAAAAPMKGVELRGAPIKAITYHDLEVAEIQPGRWRARVYFDT